MVKIVGVKFMDGGRTYFFSPGKFNIKLNDYVIVETERGTQFGKVVSGIEEASEDKVFLPLKDVIRIATNQDLITNERNIKDANKALSFAEKEVLRLKIPMKLYEASYTFDRKKLNFKFIADERVDFRDLAKSLAAKYHTRIELRQIGVRDKAKEFGGLGPCGRPLCCSEFLTNFDSVTINMAKNQGLALNPSKINGACGRLLCCLSYEDETYSKLKKGMPKIGESVNIDGKTGKVCELNVLKKTYKIKFEDLNYTEVELENGSN